MYRCSCSFGDVTFPAGTRDQCISKLDVGVAFRPVIGPRVDVFEAYVPDRYRLFEIADNVDDEKAEPITIPVSNHEGREGGRFIPGWGLNSPTPLLRLSGVKPDPTFVRPAQK